MWSEESNDRNVCRGCLNNFKESEEDTGIGVSIDLYNYCTSVLVENEDENNLLIFLCRVCHDLIHKLYFFKQQCVRSDSILKEHNKTIRLHHDKDDNKSLNSSSNYNNSEFISHEDVHFSSVFQPKINETDKINIAEERGQIKKIKKTNKGSILYCQKCDKTFYKYIKLEAHMRKHFGMKPDPTVSCTQCDKKFTTEKNLKSHLRVHTGERKYKCNTCGKTFAYLNVLKNHERAHAGIKKYVCEECGKKFVQLTNLKTHVLQHTGEKPYVCKICDRRFSQASEQKLHVLRHSGEKKYTCDICQHRFYTNSSLQKHLVTHTDTRPYECKVCNKQFKSRSYLVIHNRNHTGIRPFTCDFCPMKFISGKDKKNHSKIHSINEEQGSPKTKQTYQTSELSDNCQQSETQILNMELNNSSDLFMLNSASIKISSKNDCFSYNLHENKDDTFTIETSNQY